MSAPLSLLIILLLVVVGCSFIPAPETKVVFLDVGQGDAILLQAGTTQVLIDGGQGRTVVERLGEELPWLDRTIEVVIATHPDQDHLEGLLHVLEHYEVDLVLLPRVAHVTTLQATWLTELERKIREQQAMYRFGERGQQLQFGALKLTMLGPFPDMVGETASGKTNNASILTRVDFHDLSLLLTADAESVVEQRLVNQTPTQLLDVHVLKAGHHGSKTSTTSQLLTAASPKIVAISVGQDNRYGHPHPTVLSRLAPYQILRTDEVGSIQFTYHNNQWFMPAMPPH